MYHKSRVFTNKLTETIIMSIQAEVVSLSNGYEHDQNRMKELGFKIGDRIEVDRICISGWKTDVFLKGHDRSFNSVNFTFLEDGKPLDVFADTRFNSFLSEDKDGNKPLKGTLKNAIQIGTMIEGNIYGHPLFDDGNWIHTSRVLSVVDGVAETLNSRYNVEFRPGASFQLTD